MTIYALTSTSTTLLLGSRWVIDVQVTDDDGRSVDATPDVVVTLPGGTTSTLTAEAIRSGVYRATYTPNVSTGRYVAHVSATGYGTLDLAAYVVGPTSGVGMPTTDHVANYLREGAASWETEDLQDALDAEAAAQRAVCRVGAVYPDDLRQALLRRVQRNLAMRGQPSVVTPDENSNVSVTPTRDPEVRRLEGPYRKWAIA